MKILITNILIITSLFASAQDVCTEKIVTLLPYKKVTNDAFFKVIVLSSPECYVEHLTGFDFTWGYTYTVRLKEAHLAQPPQDASSYTYELLEVISKVAVPDGYEFTLALSRDFYLTDGDDQINNFKYVNDSTFRYMDEINVEYPADKSFLFDQILNQNKYVKATFRFKNTGTIRMQ